MLPLVLGVPRRSGELRRRPTKPNQTKPNQTKPNQTHLIDPKRNPSHTRAASSAATLAPQIAAALRCSRHSVRSRACRAERAE